MTQIAQSAGFTVNIISFSFVNIAFADTSISPASLSFRFNISLFISKMSGSLKLTLSGLIQPIGKAGGMPRLFRKFPTRFWIRFGSSNPSDIFSASLPQENP